MTFGALVVELLAAGGVLLAKGVLGELGKGAAKDAYEGLKGRLWKTHAVKTLDLVDRIDETPVLKSTIAEDIEKSGAGDDEKTLELVEALRLAIDTLPKEKQIAYSIDGSTLKAGKDIIAQRIEGIHNTSMVAEGNIELTDVVSPGK